MAPDLNQEIPSLIYGTAFAFEKTTKLVEASLYAGFRGIGAAGALGTYRKKLDGDEIRNCIQSGLIKHFYGQIQTKFSPFKPGKDPALYPYDTTADIEIQVQQSIASSFTNLGTDYVDYLVLHSIYADINDTLRAWRALEALVPARVGRLGVSNTDLHTLQRIYDYARDDTKPATVQNRFTQSNSFDPPDPKMPPGIPYPDDKYDAGVRVFCAIRGIKYTPWEVLWGSPELLDGIEAGNLSDMAEKMGVTKQVAFYACLQEETFLGGCEVSILCGTKTPRTISETVIGLRKARDFVTASEHNKERWTKVVEGMRAIVQFKEAYKIQDQESI